MRVTFLVFLCSAALSPIPVAAAKPHHATGERRVSFADQPPEVRAELRRERASLHHVVLPDIDVHAVPFYETIRAIGQGFRERNPAHYGLSILARLSSGESALPVSLKLHSASAADAFDALCAQGDYVWYVDPVSVTIAPAKEFALIRRRHSPGAPCDLTTRSSEQRLARESFCFFTLVPPASVAELEFVRRRSRPVKIKLSALFLMGFLSSLFGSSAEPPKPANRLTKIETIAINGPNGPTHGILVSVDAPDSATFASLMPSIVSTFKNQRMVSPPDTSFLLITVVGGVSAAEFKRLWDENTANNKIVEVFLSRMTKADVLHGTADGKPLDSTSLRE